MLRLLTLRWLASAAVLGCALGIGALERGCVDDGTRAAWAIGLLLGGVLGLAVHDSIGKLPEQTPQRHAKAGGCGRWPRA
jgi:hypothetical protein